jgi:hypothetical protein
MGDNGNVSPKVEENVARVDYERRVFITRDGLELTLMPVSKLILERINANQEGKPQVPKIEVLIAGKHKRLEDNPNDPEYLRELNLWTREQQMKHMRYAFWAGIKENPPEEFVGPHREFFPNATDSEMKYLWVASLLGQDGDDIGILVEAILGQNIVTEQGLEKAMDSFPGESSGTGSEVISVGEAAD